MKTVTPRGYRGSRKHVLDWTGRSSFLNELMVMLLSIPVDIPDDSKFMPKGFEEPAEAKLEIFGPRWHPSPAWDELKAWWLRHTRFANTPNWDIAVGCMIENRPGLVLVEAKANWPELSADGKDIPDDANQHTLENHEKIGNAIREACGGWQLLDKNVSISRDSHYQLANRLAFTWKLAMLGFPAILLYLGFTGDEGIRNVGEPFMSDADWQEAFSQYVSGTFPMNLFNKRLQIDTTPVWLISRSRPIIEMSVGSNS